MSGYSANLRPRSKTTNMATASYDNWVEPELCPEVAPSQFKGTAWLLGKQYLLPQGTRTCITKKGMVWP